MMVHPQAILWSDPELRDPITATGTCGLLISSCSQPGVNNLRGCFEEVHQCATDEPWTEDEFCCPASCAKTYVDYRRDGLEAIDAAAEAKPGRRCLERRRSAS